MSVHNEGMRFLHFECVTHYHLLQHATHAEGHDT